MGRKGLGFHHEGGLESQSIPRLYLLYLSMMWYRDSTRFYIPPGPQLEMALCGVEKAFSNSDPQRA